MLRLNPDLFGSAAEPLWSVCYRYWFWGWLFRDAAQNDHRRSLAAFHHNVAQRVHLPTYMRRWLACLTAWTLIAIAFDRGMGMTLASAFAFSLAVLATCSLVIAATGWVFLNQAAPRR